MVAAVVWLEWSRSYVGEAFFLALGGPIAVGAAAVLGRRSKLTIKQLVFLVFICSLLGVVGNFAGYSLGRWLGLEAATAIGPVAGTATAVLAAYLAGTLARHGANARRNEEITETFS